MAAVPTTTKPQSRMAFANVRTGVIKNHPRRVLLYGPEGIGKSTFAMGAPKPIFLCPEDGTAQLDIARFPEPHSWSDVHEAIDACKRDEHPYETLVVDTLDWIEPLVWESICKRDGKRNIEDYGYGKGYVAALDEWRKLVHALDGLRAAKRMNVVLLAHSLVKTFKNPEGEDYDRYNLKIHEKAAGLFKEWVDACLFANYETFVDKSGGGRAKGIAGGARVVHTERRAAWDAKNRYGLPEQLPLSWADFDVACGAGETRILELREQLKAAMGNNADPKLVAWVESTNDANKLGEALNRLTAKAGAKTTPAAPANGGAQ